MSIPFLDLSFDKIFIILILAMFLLGPARIKEYINTLKVWIRTAQALAENTKQQFSDEMGPEFQDIDWKQYDPRQYDPRRIVREALFDDPDADIGEALGFTDIKGELESAKGEFNNTGATAVSALGLHEDNTVELHKDTTQQYEPHPTNTSHTAPPSHTMLENSEYQQRVMQPHTGATPMEMEYVHVDLNQGNYQEQPANGLPEHEPSFIEQPQYENRSIETINFGVGKSYMRTPEQLLNGELPNSDTADLTLAKATPTHTELNKTVEINNVYNNTSPAYTSEEEWVNKQTQDFIVVLSGTAPFDDEAT